MSVAQSHPRLPSCRVHEPVHGLASPAATMQIQVNTDDNVEGRALAAWVEGVVQDELATLADWLTRIEVHIGDENAAKGGAADKRCTMEGRVRGRQPIAVTEHAATVELAVRGAVHKLARALRHLVDKQQDARR